MDNNWRVVSLNKIHKPIWESGSQTHMGWLEIPILPKSGHSDYKHGGKGERNRDLISKIQLELVSPRLQISLDEMDGQQQIWFKLEPLAVQQASKFQREEGGEVAEDLKLLPPPKNLLNPE